MALRQRLFAAIYELLSRPIEPKLAPFRQRVAGQARGDVLEIGAGTGANLPYYPAEVRLAVVEPNPFMARRLARKAAARGRALDLRVQRGETLPFPDASFDTVVCTLVLCSVTEQTRVLSEIRRVLRPGGVFRFFEHVIAEDVRLRRWQRRLTPFWSRLGDGCHLDRDTAAAIRAAGFSKVEIAAVELPVGFPLTKRCILGQAVA